MLPSTARRSSHRRLCRPRRANDSPRRCQIAQVTSLRSRPIPPCGATVCRHTFGWKRSRRNNSTFEKPIDRRCASFKTDLPCLLRIATYRGRQVGSTTNQCGSLPQSAALWSLSKSDRRARRGPVTEPATAGGNTSRFPLVRVPAAHEAHTVTARSEAIWRRSLTPCVVIPHISCTAQL